MRQGAGEMIPKGCGPDDLHDRLAIPFNVGVSEPQDSEILHPKPSIAGGVIVMKRPVRLDDQPMPEAEEVDDVSADWDLPAKFQAGQPSVSQQVP